MEYLVLARKWRPQVFEDVVGQDHVVKTLRNAIAMNRSAHAYLFSGPRGTGKTTVARILAKALNCEEGPTDRPCNQCANCREITDSASLDVREIDGASNRGIDEIRELKENIKFSAASSTYKIYIIDEVHMLTKEAFNALLKTLEEPPRHVVFVFATTEIHKVPATILSRCQHFDFKRISLGQIAGNLAHIAKEEKISISGRGVAWIARAGEGSLRDAQSLFDQVISYAGYEIADEDVEEVLGLKDRRYLSGLAQAVLERKAGQCLALVDDMYYSGVDLKQFYQLFTHHFMNLLVAALSNHEGLLADLAEEERAELKGQIQGISGKTVQRLLDMLMAGEDDMRRSEEPRLFFEYVLVKMASLEPLIPVDEMVLRLEELEQRLTLTGEAQPRSRGAGASRSSDAKVTEGERTHVPKEAPDSSLHGYEESRDGDAVPEKREVYDLSREKTGQAQWEHFKERLKRENPILCSKVTCGEFIGFDQGHLKIGFPPGHVFLDSIRDEEHISQMNRVISECTGAEVEVKIEVSEENSHNGINGGAEKARSLDEIRSTALRHPLVQKVMDTFEGAEIKDVKIKDQK